MRIAFLADPQSPNGWYRGIGPMVALEQRGHEIRQLLRLGGEFRAGLVDGCDVLQIHRAHDDRTMKLAKHAKSAGIAVVWDNDDDLTSVPKGNAAHRAYGGASGARTAAAIRKLVQLSDLVTTPSARLGGLYREYGAEHVEVIENYVRDESAGVTRPSRRGAGVTIGWLAGQEHHLDAERLPLRATFERLLGAHRDVEVVTIGVGLGIGDPRYRHVPRVRFDELDRTLAQLDVGIAPIADIPLNRARSNVKLKEYAVLGVPWLASPIGSYAGLGEGEGGRLVPDDGWYEALERMVVKERERRKLAKRALKWGRAQTVSANAGEWEQRFQAAVTRVA